MKLATPTPDEIARLAALDSLHLIHSPAEERFNRITSLACRIFDVPTALISLVTHDLQWFKAAQGLDADRTARSISFCGHAIQTDDLFLVTDARKHPDFADNPLVTGPPHLRFYAGEPLHYQGRRLGTLCLIDSKPRELSQQDRDTLRQLARWVENELAICVLSPAQQSLLASIEEEGRNDLIDPQTRCWNRTALDQLWPAENTQHQGAERTVFALRPVLDDTTAPPPETHDGLLATLCKEIRATIRPQDLLARYGVDSLLLLCNHMDQDRAGKLAQQLLDRIESTDWSARNAAAIALSRVALPGDARPTLDEVWSRCEVGLQQARVEGASQCIEIPLSSD